MLTTVLVVFALIVLARFVVVGALRWAFTPITKAVIPSSVEVEKGSVGWLTLMAAKKVANGVRNTAHSIKENRIHASKAPREVVKISFWDDQPKS